MTDALRMMHGVGNRNRTSLGNTEHGEAIEAGCIHDGFKVGHESFERDFNVAAMLTLVRLGWGQENPAFRQLFTSQFIPGGTKEQADWFNELQRISATPEDAARNLIANGNVDVTELLAQVSVPTLVMHSRDETRVPFDQGRQLAAGIAGARFVPLPSRNHLILEDEPAFPRFLQEIRTFLAT